MLFTAVRLFREKKKKERHLSNYTKKYIYKKLDIDVEAIISLNDQKVKTRSKTCWISNMFSVTKCFRNQLQIIEYEINSNTIGQDSNPIFKFKEKYDNNAQ